MLTLVTTRSGPYAEAAVDFVLGYLRAHWPYLAVAERDLRFLVDSLVRLVISHAVRPADRPVEEVAQAFGRLAVKLLTP